MIEFFVDEIVQPLVPFYLLPQIAIERVCLLNAQERD
jgi:hypothetical protein